MGASACDPDFGGGETAHDLVKTARTELSVKDRMSEHRKKVLVPSAGGDDVSGLAADDVRLEDRAITVQVVVRGKQRCDLDVGHAHLLAQSDNGANLLQTLLRRLL